MSRLSSLGATATLLDPAEVAAPLLQQPLHFMQDQAAAPQWMLDTHQHILRSDGFMVHYIQHCPCFMIGALCLYPDCDPRVQLLAAPRPHQPAGPLPPRLLQTQARHHRGLLLGALGR